MESPRLVNLLSILDMRLLFLVIYYTAHDLLSDILLPEASHMPRHLISVAHEWINENPACGLRGNSRNCWDPRNNLGQHHSGSRACTLLIATVNQCNPCAQYRLDCWPMDRSNCHLCWTDWSVSALTNGGTNLAVNFTVLPFGRDLLNNIEITQCTSKVWVARKLVKLADFAWDPRNDLGRHHAGGRVCTLLIASINQQDPKMQFRCDVT